MKTDLPGKHIYDAEAVASEELADEELFRLIAETVNVTSRQPLKKHLHRTTSNVALAQENATLEDQLSQTCRRGGGRADGKSLLLHLSLGLVASPPLE